MWALRVIPVFVSGRPRLTIGIFSLPDHFLPPRERLVNLDSLEPSSFFQIESRLDPFAWIVRVDFRELSTGLYTVIKKQPGVGSFIVPVFALLSDAILRERDLQTIGIRWIWISYPRHGKGFT